MSTEATAHRLRSAGIDVLHDSPIPFPLGNWRAEFVGRLSCKPTDVPVPTVDEAPLCGWQWPTVDVNSGLPNAAMHDVLDAIQWVRDNAATYRSGFNTKVAAVGGSSGGNLLYRGVMGLSSGDTHIPEVAGGWSGNVYFSHMLGDIGENQPFYCDGAPSQDRPDCWIEVIKYLSCDIRPVARGCVDIYHDAEPINVVGDYAPDTYIANSAMELVNIWNQTDLAVALGNHLALSRSCTPPGDSHGRAYVLTGHCANLPGDPVVIVDQLAWFHAYVFP